MNWKRVKRRERRIELVAEGRIDEKRRRKGSEGWCAVHSLCPRAAI